VPAPLIRVPTGTTINVTVRNALADSMVWVRGLHTRPAERFDSVGIAPGESKTLTFAAGEPGTYAYGAFAGIPDHEVREREQVIGAFVVDSSGVTPRDRVFVMNVWGEPVDSNTYSNAVTINGKSFPFTEQVEATTGDTLRWRWVNGTIRPHPMHLHGFYFTVDSRGSALRDNAFDATQKRTVVTEVMNPIETMSMTWVPDRVGKWLFHCHIAFHTASEAARLETPSDPHAMMSDDPGVHMAGLVLGINVQPAAGWVAESRENPRTLRLFVREGPKLGKSKRGMGYSIDHFGSTPTDTITQVGGPPIVLTRGQPTDITVINQLNEPTAVHWHGLELESYSDGVAGFSGQDGRVAPRIAASDSFTARLTMPRAGTFIYHTHLNDLEQLTSGLYGALIVREPRDTFDPSTDHVFVAGWDGHEEPPKLLINGDSALAPMTWRAGGTHRFRFIDIGPAAELRVVLTQGADTMMWRPVAKDGSDLPAHQVTPRPARTAIDVGETADFLFTPPKRGEYVLTMMHSVELPPVIQRIVVR
jgi:FtsP/CotA-like multicopper oxidase with cupredoxin domain